MITELDAGFPIEDPSLVVPWGLSERKLGRLLAPHHVREITSGYLVLPCVSLNGLKHNLGFHFDRNCRSAKYWLEFFRDEYPDQQQSYDEFQRHLELTFGPPTCTESGNDGFPSHRWVVGDWEVWHSIYERFVLCEGVSITPRWFGRGK